MIEVYSVPLTTLVNEFQLEVVFAATDYEKIRITVEDAMCLDSSNIRPEEWQTIAKTVFEARLDYDGIVISHGTDTMAYTAAALSYLIQNSAKPIVLTGSQKSIYDQETDARRNLYDAFLAAQDDALFGVMLVFDGRVILDEDTLVMRRNAADNEYFHPSFHRSLNTGLNYVGETHGEAAVMEIGHKSIKLSCINTDISFGKKVYLRLHVDTVVIVMEVDQFFKCLVNREKVAHFLKYMIGKLVYVFILVVI